MNVYMFHDLGGSQTSPFSRGGHVLQTLFPKAGDAGEVPPTHCLCTASYLVLQVMGGRYTHSVSALLLVIGGCRTHSVSALLLVADIREYVEHRSGGALRQMTIDDQKESASRKFYEHRDLNIVLAAVYVVVFIWGLSGEGSRALGRTGLCGL